MGRTTDAGERGTTREPMAARGSGIFDNESASAWIADLVARDALGLVRRALAGVHQGAAHVDTARCEEALVACEAVAAWAGYASPASPEPLMEWARFRQHAAMDPGLIDDAVLAAALVLRESTLAETWRRSPDYADWRRVVEHLIARLQQTRRTSN
jgi:hypothetical protein